MERIPEQRQIALSLPLCQALLSVVAEKFLKQP
jgi:hypothetical protein